MNKHPLLLNYDVADAELIRSVIQRVATGPELSKNISYDEARATMHALLDGSADPVQAGIFLIGLRMKRETTAEIKGILDAIRDRTAVETAKVSDVVDVSDPYNGYNRTLPASFFVLPVVAACGVNAYSHGVERMGPKFGVTHHDILRSLGGDPHKSVSAVCDQLTDSDIGWGYVDQSVYCPALHDLTDLRTRIVKRPVITTVEVVTGPIKGASATHMVTGFVHKPYPPVYAMLARHVGFDSMMVIRGTEGGIIPSFRQRGRVVRYVDSGEEVEVDIEPEELGLKRDYRAAAIPDDMPLADETSDRVVLKWDISEFSKACADRGVEALQGIAGPANDAVVFGAALILWHTGRVDSVKEGAMNARRVIDSGEALARLYKLVES